ncbi:MAG: hypothetical protein AAF517_10395 [Planctomycetota bacterium]
MNTARADASKGVESKDTASPDAAAKASHYGHALEVLEYARIGEILSSYASSALGRRLAARMKPFDNLEKVRSVLAEAAEMRDFLRTERVPLQGLADVSAELKGIREGGQPAEPDLLYRVVDLIRAGQSLKAALTKDVELFPQLHELGAGFQDLPDIRERIPEAVDPKDGVRDEASEKLATLRREARELRDRIRRQTQAIQRRPKLSRCFQSDGLTVRNDRYLLPVKAEYRSWVDGPIRYRSTKGSTLYVEPQEVVLDGDKLVDLVESVRREETRILWELTREVLDARRAIDRIQSRLARVDFTYAKASYAAAFDLEAPLVNDEGRLELKDARHPLLLWHERDHRSDIRDVDLEALHKKVMPLGLRLGDDAKLLIITGPNTGGKTIVLKTIGLSVLVALSGVPIPAAHGSEVPLVRGVFADIGDEQSIEQNLSTFSAHLKHIGEVLSNACDKSLILLDELGSGTDPLEGAALGRALLDHFREKEWTAIITTHLGSLKQYAFLHDQVENAAMEFDQRTLTPTYRLLLGVPGNSNALAVAKRLGIDESILEAAKEEIEEVEEPTRDLISKMEKSRRRIEKERRRTEKLRRRAQGDAKAYESRMQEVDARRESLDREADEEVDRIIREARDELRDILKRLKNVPNSHRAVVDELEERVETMLVSTPLGEKREAFAKSLKKEHEVYIPRFKCRATVRKINKTERVLTVLIDGIPTEIGFDDITWVGLEQPE